MATPETGSRRLICRFTQASMVSGLQAPSLVPCAPLDWANAGAANIPMVIVTTSTVRMPASPDVAREYHKLRRLGCSSDEGTSPMDALIGVIRYGFVHRAT